MEPNKDAVPKKVIPNAEWVPLTIKDVGTVFPPGTTLALYRYSYDWRRWNAAKTWKWRYYTYKLEKRLGRYDLINGKKASLLKYQPFTDGNYEEAFI